MIQKISAPKRHFNDYGWLKTYWLFSFSDYYDPQNLQHGALRVFNDDIVAPHTGFETHPHQEMEIISIVLSGEMVHRDTMGNVATIKTGDVQRMTAGTGLYHSEKNESNAPVHFFQIWLSPDTSNLVPSYDQHSFNADSWKNKLTLLASSKKNGPGVSLNTEGSIYRATFTEDSVVQHQSKPGSKLFLYVISGSLSVNGIILEERDQGRIAEETNLDITSTNTDFLLIETPGKNR